jgi:general secretion pathway protein K
MTSPNPRDNEAGAALILVVWAIGIMALIATIVARSAHIYAASAYGERNDLAATLLAEGGLRMAVDLWDTGHPDFRNGEAIICRHGNDVLRLEVRPTSALIDLNTAPEGLLSGLVLALGEDERQAKRAAAAIADYRDADDTPRPGGGERIAYEREGRSHPANRPFRRVSELAAVAGMPQRLVDAARPHLTLLNGTPSVTLARASAPVRAAVQQPASIAQPLPPSRISVLEDSISRLSQSHSNGEAGAPLMVRAGARLQGGRVRVIEATFGRTGRGGPSRPIVESRSVSASATELDLRPNGSLPTCY